MLINSSSSRPLSHALYVVFAYVDVRRPTELAIRRSYLRAAMGRKGKRSDVKAPGALGTLHDGS